MFLLFCCRTSKGAGGELLSHHPFVEGITVYYDRFPVGYWLIISMLSLVLSSFQNRTRVVRCERDRWCPCGVTRRVRCWITGGCVGVFLLVHVFVFCLIVLSVFGSLSAL